MDSIRDDAVFAWGLVGINENLANFGHGLPGRGSQPHGLPAWDPNARPTAFGTPEGQASSQLPCINGYRADGTGLTRKPATEDRERCGSRPSSSLDRYGPEQLYPSSSTPHPLQQHCVRPTTSQLGTSRASCSCAAAHPRSASEPVQLANAFYRSPRNGRK